MEYEDVIRFTDRRGVAKHGSKGSWRLEQAVTPTGGDNERCDLGELVSKERFAFLCDRRGVAKHGSKGSWRLEQAVTPTGGDNERCDLGELVSKERFAFLCGV
ncbi:hypothetical protein Q1695_000228 [Nippostrongylus brasiliensis]|nr:hypothetical protein Q1695_000228 [Nippostrongylus brasiliensis]